MQLFIDLDGTLLDISEKYYRLYADCVRLLGGTPIPKNRYWSLKRAKQPPSRILAASSLPETKKQDYTSLFAKDIESPRYTSFDRLYTFAIPALEELKKRHELYLVCGRKDHDAGMRQIAQFGLGKFFLGIVVGRGDQNGEQFKRETIKRLCDPNNHFATIGDTEDDINCATGLSGITVGVLSGLRNKKTLTTLSHPAYVIADIRGLQALLDNIAKHE